MRSRGWAISVEAKPADSPAIDSTMGSGSWRTLWAIVDATNWVQNIEIDVGRWRKAFYLFTTSCLTNTIAEAAFPALYFMYKQRFEANTWIHIGIRLIPAQSKSFVSYSPSDGLPSHVRQPFNSGDKLLR